MNGLISGWFSEFSPEDAADLRPKNDHRHDPKQPFNDASEGFGWPGQALSLEVEKVLYHKRSKFQDILVFESKSYGNVLVLDGAVQVTERDEFSYSEMIGHISVLSHPNPKKVLMIGGGDGGVIREVLKHDVVESVVLCDIDEDVIDVSKKFLKSTACSFSDPRTTVVIGDGLKFMEEHKNEFDIVITDSSDPIGPAVSLYQKPYYELVKSALKEDGILCSQAESVWLQLKLIEELHRFCRTLFPVVSYAWASTPCYPCGSIGFLFCSKNSKTNFRIPLRHLSAEQVQEMRLKYYNVDIHRAAFVLPQFANEVLDNS